MPRGNPARSIHDCQHGKRHSLSACRRICSFHQHRCHSPSLLGTTPNGWSNTRIRPEYAKLCTVFRQDLHLRRMAISTFRRRCIHIFRSTYSMTCNRRVVSANRFALCQTAALLISSPNPLGLKRWIPSEPVAPTIIQDACLARQACWTTEQAYSLPPRSASCKGGLLVLVLSGT